MPRGRRRLSTPVTSISSEAEDSRSNDKVDANSDDASLSKSSEVVRQLRKLEIENTGKFLENWNPESSTRETRKLTRKIYSEGGSRKHYFMYDDQGVFLKSNTDFCDCLEDGCPGCHFLCPKCSSQKCGHDCRNGRKWTYDFVDVEGADFSVRNKHK